MDYISLTGSVASIGGAIVSVYSAIKANKIKNAIIGRLHLNKISELRTLAKVTLPHINRICLPESKIRGVNISEIVSPLLVLQAALNENKDILKHHEFDNYDKITGSLKKELKKLKYEKDKSQFRIIGESLHDDVDFIISELSRISRSKVEK